VRKVAVNKKPLVAGGYIDRYQAEAGNRFAQLTIPEADVSQQKQRIFLGLMLAVLVVILLGIAWPFASAMILASILSVGGVGGRFCRQYSSAFGHWRPQQTESRARWIRDVKRNLCARSAWAPDRSARDLPYRSRCRRDSKAEPHHSFS